MQRILHGETLSIRRRAIGHLTEPRRLADAVGATGSIVPAVARMVGRGEEAVGVARRPMNRRGEIGARAARNESEGKQRIVIAVRVNDNVTVMDRKKEERRV